MKRLVSALLLAAAMSGSTCAFAALERKEDRFSGATTWTAKFDLAERHSEYMLVPDSVHLIAEVGRDSTPRASLMIMASNGTGGRSPGWRYLGVTRILWLADGQPLELGVMIPTRTARRGFVVEHFIQPLTLAELQRIADAQLVEFKIGADEFRLPAELQAAAKEAVVHLQAEGGGEAASSSPESQD